jgi:hypothetical protein
MGVNYTLTCTPLLLLLLAHLGADFLGQTDRAVRARNQGSIWPYLTHGATIAAAFFIALHVYGLAGAVLIALAVTGIHLAQDWLRDRLGRGCSPRIRLWLFLTDQALHLSILVVIWARLGWRPDGRVLQFYARLIRPAVTEAAASLGGNLPGLSIERILLATVVYVGVMFGGAVLLRYCLDLLPTGTAGGAAGTAGAPDRIGRAIGILERGLILTLVLADVLSAVGFVIAAKSVARFKDLENKEFAEYYLVGTLASTLLALGAGLALKAVMA